MMPLTFYRFLFLFVTFSLISSALSAKDFPNKPINLVVPFAPGGGTDSIARDLAKNLTEQLGQTVIVDNRAGGGGAIGAQMVAKAEPDGHTLLFVTSTFITHAATENTLSYDVIKDFTPIAMIGRGPLMVVANSELGLSSIQDLVKYTKANPNGVNFCSAGQGSINHLAGELFKQKTNLEMTHVPYKGSGPATLDLLAGRVQVFFATMPTMLQYVKSNKVTLLAMTSDKRSSLFPQVPTVAESGVPGFNITTWWGVVAPAKLPPEILKKLNQEIRIASAKEPLKTRLVNEGATPFQTEPEEMQNLLEKELRMWRDLVKTAKIKVD
jgi:tripartite-type tricarboxylate transporter receptor subunit TctC